MKCKRCKNNINVFSPPFGAYFCKKNHGQCGVCELKTSSCECCGEETKYKSPHFVPEKDYSPKTVSTTELQVPIIRDVEPTAEEEAEFRKIRLLFLNNDPTEINYFRAHNELNVVRTLSALITKDLCSAKNDNKPQEARDESDFRFKKIMRALRETGCPDEQQDHVSEEEDVNEITNEDDAEGSAKLHMLYPQHSRMRKLAAERTSSTTFLSKISIKFDDEPQDDPRPPKKEVEHTENSALNLADFKALSCLNLTNCPPTGFPISIEAVNLDRHPFHCPISNCLGKIFLSDFNQHIVHDHPTLPLSYIKFGQFRELFIDAKLCKWTPHTIAGFLMTDIVTNFSAPPMKDILPMLLIMGRYRFNENEAEAETFHNMAAPVEDLWTHWDSLVIWMTGIVPEGCEISVGISLFSKADEVLSRWYIDLLNPIQNPMTVEHVFQASRRLVLSYREVKMLTNDFQNTLRCQVGLVNHLLKTEGKTT